MGQASRGAVSAQRRPEYPVGIPVQPPPGWKPRSLPPSLPATSRSRHVKQPPASPFTAHLGLLLKATLLALMVFVLFLDAGRLFFGMF